ncbi:MAG: YbhB/YbcL family Raf kinase inhibitor-like protein [Dokdonella sp.]|nr:MAG: YbhB/YbcL family Raf kinase inhibitor-like protein [Dokdonella sp.]
MQIHSNDFRDGAPIPAVLAFGQPGSAGEACVLSANRSPHLAWSGAPAATRSFVITCIDIDVPSRGDDVNQAGRTVPTSLPRVEFVHWLIANIGPEVHELAQGACADGIVARGKAAPPGPPGSVQGCNDYTSWFATDADMAGRYLGYDGPCPPWNDALVHRYCFSVHALDVARLDLAPGFDLAQLRAALQGHVLATATLTGTYTLNPALRG